MNKKGQVTIFIIIAVLVVAGIVLFFSLRGNIGKDGSFTPETKSLQLSVQECIDETFIDGILYISLQGGYNNLPKGSLITEFSNVAFGYNRGNTLVSISDMEFQINSYLEEVLPLCVDQTSFPDLIIDYSSPEIKTEIQKNSISTKINYPITVTQEDSTSIIKDFESEVFVELGEMHQTANQIINEKLSSNYIDLTYLSNLDYEVNILPQDENLFIYSIIDKETELNNVFFTFNFAVRK